MPKKRKRKTDSGHVDETWLIPYADMLTLLLALFIVLFAMSIVDAQKFEQLSQTLSNAFSGGESYFEYTSPVPPPMQMPQEDDEEEGLDPDAIDDPVDESDELERTEFEEEMSELERIQQIINTYINDNNLQLSLSTKLTEDGLMITILDNALFDSGSATLRPQAQELAEEISNLLDTDPPRHITIAGHTDDIPIRNADFRSNWDLSAMRAINFMEILLENENLLPERMSSTAYGEYRPVETNETQADRQQNRRVEVLILPRFVIGN